MLVMVQSKDTVLPVLGHAVSKSVLMSNPLLQHFRDVAELVQVAVAATEVVVVPAIVAVTVDARVADVVLCGLTFCHVSDLVAVVPVDGTV